jgi:rhodanese-related sulfurtransferase
VTISGPIRSIDVAEAARQLADAGGAAEGQSGGGPILLDVRELNEFRVIRVPGAALLPMSTFTEHYTELPKDRPLLVMCAAGRRSMVVTEFLARNGYSQAVNVTGGIDAWQRAGLPVSEAMPGPDEGRLPGA